jgi:ATP-dependent DNA helicase RecQ
LHLSVAEVTGGTEASKAALAALRRSLGAPREPRGAGIVYAATRKGAEKLAATLCTTGWRARAYHAGIAADERANVSKEFAERVLPIVVATNAFGMGIDRPDVRVVVHAQPPASIEAYYQEVGRAGRDGAPAEGVLCIAPSDIALRRRLAALGEGGAPADPADAARAWRLFRELLRYVDAATCRHDFILRYFGDEAESLGGCGHCDVCRNMSETLASDPAIVERHNDILRRVLAGVARSKASAGMQNVAAMLRGDATERVRHLALNRLSTFGVLDGMPHGEVMAVLRATLAAGWVDLTMGDFPVPIITESGWRVMRGQDKPAVHLPLGRKPRVPGDSACRPARASDDPSRQRVSAEGAKARPRAAAGPVPDLDARHQPLYDALRKRRTAIAKEAKLPPYVIATDRTLVEMAMLAPLTTDDLRLVRGMGNVRIARYGAIFLEIVRESKDGGGR